MSQVYLVNYINNENELCTLIGYLFAQDLDSLSFGCDIIPKRDQLNYGKQIKRSAIIDMTQLTVLKHDLAGVSVN